MAGLGFIETVLLGSIVGFTVYLGLPVAMFKGLTDRKSGILNGVAIGILTFLLVEILLGVIEPVEESVEHLLEGELAVMSAGGIWFAAVFGFAIGLIGLAWFEDHFISKTVHGGLPSSSKDSMARASGWLEHRGTALSLMIAIGIGLHNFSEGLAIGQAAASGAMSLSLLLIVGFGFHNITEGFGIAAPLADEKPSVLLLFVAGLLAGGPTFLGTIIGQVWISTFASVLFLALAGGALIYVIEELFHVGRDQISKMGLMISTTLGFFLALLTELLIEIALLL